jgi:uncharacterized protein involved in type VI secretion and phage assembly
MDDATVVERTIEQQQNRYYGKYRGFVVDNKDPERRGRVRCTVPTVLGEATTDWALPCFPYGGAAGLGFFAVPPRGAQILVEFMEGDRSSPLWTGTFWRTKGEVPAEIAGDEPTMKLLKTESGHLLGLDDKPGEETVTLGSAKEAKLVMDEKGSLALTDAKGATVTLDAEASEVRVEDANGNTLTLSSSGIAAKDASGNEITTSAGGVTVKGAVITIQGQSVAIGGAGGEPLLKGASFLAMFNAHTHNCTAPGTPSGPPVPPLTPAALSLVATTT